MWLSDAEMEQHMDSMSPCMLGPEPMKFVNQVKDSSGNSQFSICCIDIFNFMNYFNRKYLTYVEMTKIVLETSLRDKITL